MNKIHLNKAWVHLISPGFFKVLDGFKFSKNKTNKNPYSDINLPTWLYCVIITTTAYHEHYNNLDISTFNIMNLY